MPITAELDPDVTARLQELAKQTGETLNAIGSRIRRAELTSEQRQADGPPKRR